MIGSYWPHLTNKKVKSEMRLHVVRTLAAK